jgi:hypothetical protein
MNRAQRRAAERFARKSVQTSTQISAAQLAANQANAQLSTGPRTEEGRAISSRNAIKTGLTGLAVLLPSDDLAEYEANLLANHQRFQPVGLLEHNLVQAVTDTEWRLRRISSLEHAVFAKGRIDFKDQCPDPETKDPVRRGALLDLLTMQAYFKELRNLQLQESRLSRRREKDIAELRQLQQNRIEREAQALEEAAELYLAAQKAEIPFTPPENGFVFSNDQILAFIAATQTPKTREIVVRRAA